ncbi:MAG: hypothetical protein GY777_29630 [Candidatus Brocadiaceae bacterium]|nr:hypothetical protein [Candidatus Brocadiaceae bacterium]
MDVATLTIISVTIALISGLTSLWFPKGNKTKICLTILAIFGFLIAIAIIIVNYKLKDTIPLVYDKVPESAYIHAKFDINLENENLSCLKDQILSLQPKSGMYLNYPIFPDSIVFQNCSKIRNILLQSNLSFYFADSSKKEKSESTALIMQINEFNQDRLFSFYWDEDSDVISMNIDVPVKIKRSLESSISSLQQFRGCFVWAKYIFYKHHDSNPFGSNGLKLKEFWIKVDNPDMTFNADDESIQHKMYEINGEKITGTTFNLIDHNSYTKKYGGGYIP